MGAKQMPNNISNKDKKRGDSSTLSTPHDSMTNIHNYPGSPPKYDFP